MAKDAAGPLPLFVCGNEAGDLDTIVSALGGAYAKGSDPVTDTAIELRERLEAFFIQSADASTSYPETCRDLVQLATDAIRLRKRMTSTAAQTPKIQTNGTTS